MSDSTNRFFPPETHLKMEHVVPESQNLAYAVWRVETVPHGVMEFKSFRDVIDWVNNVYFDNHAKVAATRQVFGYDEGKDGSLDLLKERN